MKPLALNVTGIRTDDGGTTHRLKPALLCYAYDVANYQSGRRRLGLDAQRRKVHARNLAEWIEVNRNRPILAIGHSDGCLLLLKAFRLLGERSVEPTSLCAVFINAALSPNVAIPACVSRVDVMHDPHDGWTGIAAAWLHRLTFGRHPYGAMGQRGYTGPDVDRVHNIKIGDGRNGARDHSSIFDAPTALADLIVRRHHKHLKETEP